jgi:hypothetical protein
MRVLKFTVPVLVALLLASCGDDSQPETAAPTTTRATSDAARFCEIIADDTGYLEGLERVVPKDMASGAAAAESLARLFAAIDDEQADPADFPVDEVSERLAVDGVDESLDRLADKAAADCDDEDAADAIRMIATFGAIVSAPKDDGYCSKLEASIRSEGDSEDPSRFQREISNLAEAAPEAHRRALEEIAEVVTAEEQPPESFCSPPRCWGTSVAALQGPAATTSRRHPQMRQRPTRPSHQGRRCRLEFVRWNWKIPRTATGHPRWSPSSGPRRPRSA